MFSRVDRGLIKLSTDVRRAVMLSKLISRETARPKPVASSRPGPPARLANESPGHTFRALGLYQRLYAGLDFLRLCRTYIVLDAVMILKYFVSRISLAAREAQDLIGIGGERLLHPSRSKLANGFLIAFPDVVLCFDFHVGYISSMQSSRIG